MARAKDLDVKILEIIREYQCFEQSHIQSYLQEKGYDIPQATLSRRLKSLKIAKVSGVYRCIDLQQQPSLPLILNVKISDFGMIILHTQPGHANGLAYYFDQKYVNVQVEEGRQSDLLGTLAGDDTVLLVLKNLKSLQQFKEIILQDFPYLKNNV